jgi:hypothetical protein
MKFGGIKMGNELKNIISIISISKIKYDRLYSPLKGCYCDTGYYITQNNDSTRTLYGTNNEAILTTSNEISLVNGSDFGCIVDNGDGTMTAYDSDDNEILTSSKTLENVSKGGIVITKQAQDYVDSNGNPVYLYGAIRKADKWEDAISSIERGTEKVSVDLAENETISSDLLKAVKEKDTEVIFNLPNGLSWTINSSDISDNVAESIDLNVSVTNGVIPQAAINSLDFKGTTTEISLAHSGEFGFKAYLHMNLGEKNSGKYANLFWYNEAENKLEFMETASISSDGEAVFTYTHASDYLIIVSEAAYTAKNEEPSSEEKEKESTVKQENPSTSETIKNNQEDSKKQENTENTTISNENQTSDKVADTDTAKKDIVIDGKGNPKTEDTNAPFRYIFTIVGCFGVIVLLMGNKKTKRTI